MAKHTETVMVRDRGKERAVKVTIDAPNPGALDIQVLAQEAWLRPAKNLKIGNVNVQVAKFERR